MIRHIALLVLLLLPNTTTAGPLTVICNGFRYIGWMEPRAPLLPPGVFKAWTDSNLLYPQSGFASTISVGHWLLTKRSSATNLLDTKLSVAQLKAVRQTLHRVHKAYKISMRRLGLKIALALPPLLNIRLQELWSTLANNSTGVLGKLMKEIDRSQLQILPNELSRDLGWDVARVRAEAIDKVMTDPEYEPLLKRTTAVYELFERTLRDQEFRAAARTFRNGMRGGAQNRPSGDSTELQEQFRKAVKRLFRESPIEGMTEEQAVDLCLYVSLSSG